MRALFTLLIAGLVALGAVLVGCDGGDDQQQQEQQAQQSGEAEQRAQSDQAAGSDRATAVQRSTQSSQAGQADQASSQQEVQQDQPQRTATDATIEGPIAEATAAFEAWAADLESLVYEINVDFNLGGLASVIDSTIVAQLEPLYVWATIDASSLFTQTAMLFDDQSDQADQSLEPLIMQILISEDAAYVSMPQVEGWIDLTDDFDGSLGELTAMLGGNPEDFADPASQGQALSCVEAVGGSVTEGNHAGERVWVVECEIDVESLDDATVALLRERGIEVGDAGIERMHMMLTISQNSGAPLLVESHVTLQDAFGLSVASDEQSGDEDAPRFYVSTSAMLASWNEPIEFPTPEPLIDGSFLDVLGDSPSSSGASSGSDLGSSSEPPELLSTEELLGLATEWVAAADELNMQFVAQAVIDGEARLASTIVLGSRTQGAFETYVSIDDASTFRLLWNRDGIWTSDTEVDGEPIWAPSNPALLGFAGQTVDELLATPDRLYLEPFASLLDFAWLTRTIQGSRPAVYELVIETGYLTPEDPFFNEIVVILKGETAELLAESVYIESIDHYSTVLTVIGDSGQVTSQITTAEFQTDAGRVELVASLNIVSNGPIEFSTPTK